MMDELPTHQAAFVRVMAAWNSAMSTWDSKTLAQLYTEQALFVGSLPGLRQGRSGVCDYFSSIPGRSVQLRFTEKKLLSLSEGCFMVSGIVVFEQDIDSATRELERRLSLVIEHVKKDWLIALHHVSLIPAVEGEFLY